MRSIKIYGIVLALFLSVSLNAQNTATNSASPKLVVGIVIDQMRYDYLTRFQSQYSDRGFMRLINQGFNCKNNNYNYVPTYTGPGHASIYTGTTPATHGIIANNWYDKFEKKTVYCAEDDDVTSVGTEDAAGKMSPHRMKTTTIGDQNRFFTQFKGKTIGISLKDRGAILPAGHTANAAYWFHGYDEGKWISSSYYMDKLPDWVAAFNASGQADSYLKPWDTYYGIETYTESGVDENDFEGGFKGKDKATFPYNLKKLRKENNGYDILKSTPYGNDLTADFAIAALDGENLGADAITDFLTVSFSSTDYVGHNFGVNSKEIEDTYIRLDLALARLLDALDAKVGEGNYVVFLTADHGAVDVPAYLKSMKAPGGYFDANGLKEKVGDFLKKEFKVEGLIANSSNYQIFFDYDKLEKEGIKPEKLESALAHLILQFPQVDQVFTRTQLQNTTFSEGMASIIQKGFNVKRSGDVILVLDPDVITYSEKGSTHGSGFSYDTHVPLLFYGKGIKKGSTFDLTHVDDIAVTIAALLGIEFPSGATGTVITKVLE